MNKAEFYEIIANALEVDVVRINDDLEMGSIDEWDSLGHLTILTSLDDATDGKIESIPNFGKLKSIKSMIGALVENKLLTV